MYRTLRNTALMLSSCMLGGCLLISPYSNQLLSSRTQAIPFQAWTPTAGASLHVECMPTNRFGPEITSYGPWTEVSTLTASSSASLDLSGAAMYSAAKSISLPQSCWYLNQSNGYYYTSLRVQQSGSSSHFHTVDRDGVTCSATSVAARGSWMGWFQDKCYSRFSNGSYVPWLTIRTQS